MRPGKGVLCMAGAGEREMKLGAMGVGAREVVGDTV